MNAWEEISIYINLFKIAINNVTSIKVSFL